MEFTTILVAPDADLIHIAVQIEAELLALGYASDRLALRVALDPGRGVFDEASPGAEARVGHSFAELPEAVSRWQGWSTEYWTDSLLLYLQVARVRPGSHINIWMDVGQRQLGALCSEGRLHEYLAAAVAVAKASDAIAGYGHDVLEYHELTPERAPTSFEDMPEYPGEHSDLGIIRAQGVSPAQARARWGQNFRVNLSTRGYWLLVDRAFEAEHSKTAS